MTVPEILAALPKLNVLVVGDICLDLWCRYDQRNSEPSRETGLSRIGVVGFESSAGAAGTIANNLADLKVGRVAVMGVIGDDLHGEELFRTLAHRNIDVDLVVRSELVQTFTYMKLIEAASGEEDRPRVDFINTSPLPPALEQRLVEGFEQYGEYYDAVLICDQAETDAGGVVTAALRESINRHAKRTRKTVWVDSRMRAEHFRGCYLKPNEQEAKEASLRLLGREDVEAMAHELELRALVVTLGERGAMLVEGGRTELIPPASAEKPVDICGAGDSFSAAAASALAAGAGLAEAVKLGNLAASITIQKKGTGTASPGEVMAKL
jgi:rfaE bifunctional protein kinase chain/domain